MKHILMVDDVATNLKCVVEILRDQYKVTTAKSGMQALELLKEITPDLILLDVNMPQMDGFAVFEWLKAKPELVHIPVIFQTAENNPQKEEKGLQMGAADFVHKPYAPDDLCDRIEKALYQSTSPQTEAKAIDLFRTYEEQRKWLTEDVFHAKAGYFLLFFVNGISEIMEKFGELTSGDVMYAIVKVLEEEIDEETHVYCISKDRIVIFLKNKPEPEQIKTIVRRMIAGVEFEVGEPLAEELDIKISLSAGIAKKPEDGLGYAELYDCADKALYFLKQSGKRGYYFYSMEQNEKQSADEKKTPIYVIQIQRMLQEGIESGEEKESFDKACQLLSLYLKSKKQKAQVLWLRIKDAAQTQEKQHAVEVLGKVITDSLRQGDVSIPCGDSQYVLILLKASRENANKVAERIHQKWNKELPDINLELQDEIRSL